MQNSNIKLKEYPSDDMTEEKIHSEILKYAKILSRKSDIKLKKIKNGILPENFPEEVRKKASMYRNNKKNFEKLMKNPNSIWGFCTKPMYKINSINWCDNIYAAKSAGKLNDCKNSFCMVCCDNLAQIYQNISQKSSIGKLLMFNKQSGFRRINRAVTTKEISICRKQCNHNFPVKKVFILPQPPRFPDLGIYPTKSAKSCADIKKWGDIQAKSGIYWIDLGMKGKTKVFCDMETDNGGWTLFFNYKYDYENKNFKHLFIDSTRLPENLYLNSHINLSDAGFENDDISELRFYCEESYPKKNFIHFKISNYHVNQLAINGDQTKISPKIWKKNYTDLVPDKLMTYYNRVLNSQKVKDIDTNNTSANGGFWNTPFGSSKLNVFWSVIGENKGQMRLECGNTHRDVMSGENLAIKTQHTIYFRGAPMKDEDARIRYVNYTKLK